MHLNFCLNNILFSVNSHPSIFVCYQKHNRILYSCYLLNLYKNESGLKQTLLSSITSFSGLFRNVNKSSFSVDTPAFYSGLTKFELSDSTLLNPGVKVPVQIISFTAFMVLSSRACASISFYRVYFFFTSPVAAPCSFISTLSLSARP